jgi:hypothetical protein
MLYFTPFPTIQYKIPNSTKSIPVTDLTRRFSLANFLKNNNVAFDTYIVQDGDRPDRVAYGYYGDVTMDWLVLLSNEIHDPYFQWPMSYQEFGAYMEERYGSVEYTQQTTHHYEKIIQQAYVQNDYGTQRLIPEKTVTVDYTTFAALTDFERKYGTAVDGGISIFEHELALNDERRKIYLMDLNYLQVIKEQHPFIFDGVTVR